MSSDLHHAVTHAIRQRRLLLPGQRAGVAVSGGADSLALLFLLHDLRHELGIVLRVVHLNHQLRGAEADADQEFVAALAARLDLECTAQRSDVRAIALQQGWNLEDAGRRLRQSFFEVLVKDGAVDRLAVAHTADDQAETVLMHLLRGTGISGLAGIHPLAGPVVRPLLGIRRSQLRAYLLARGQAWREDPTNDDTSRLRARIRHHLLPLLEREYQSSVTERLGSLADLAQKDDALLGTLTARSFQALVEPCGGCFSIGAADLLAPLPGEGTGAPLSDCPALSARLVRLLIETVRGDRNRITARHVEDVLALAARAESGLRLELPGALVEKRFGEMVFLPARAQAAARTNPPSTAYQLELARPAPGEVTQACFPGGRLRAKAFDCPPQGSDTNTGAEALDWDLLQPPLLLRNWQPGDAYRPRARRTAHKLKRLFWEEGVPVEARASWPVLTSAGRIVWTRTFGVAEEFAARANTKKAVLITEDQS